MGTNLIVNKFVFVKGFWLNISHIILVGTNGTGHEGVSLSDGRFIGLRGVELEKLIKELN
jgi:hypothetical protein